MPLLKVLLVPPPGKAFVVCACCGVVRELLLDSLTLGAGDVEHPSPHTISLPRCSCGAQEVLIRNFDTMPTQHVGCLQDVHRRAVNALAQYLKAQGRSDPFCKALHDAETAVPSDLVALNKIDLPAKAFQNAFAAAKIPGR